VIIEQISATNSIFALSTEDLLKLKKAGATDRLLQVMIRTGKESTNTSAYRVVTPSGRVEYHYRASGLGYPIVIKPVVYPEGDPIVIYRPSFEGKRRGYQIGGRLIPRMRGGYRLIQPVYPSVTPHIIIRGDSWGYR
jgi:hypothetical protein